MVMTLTVLLAAPLLGYDGQAHGGIVTSEMLLPPLGDLFPLGNNFAVEVEAPNHPALHAADPVSSPIADKSLPGPHHDAAALALFGQQVPGVPESDSSKSHRVQSIYRTGRPEVSPAGSVSLFRSSARLHLSDPHLCRLFRPPRHI